MEPDKKDRILIILAVQPVWDAETITPVPNFVCLISYDWVGGLPLLDQVHQQPGHRDQVEDVLGYKTYGKRYNILLYFLFDTYKNIIYKFTANGKINIFRLFYKKILHIFRNSLKSDASNQSPIIGDEGKRICDILHLCVACGDSGKASGKH